MPRSYHPLIGKLSDSSPSVFLFANPVTSARPRGLHGSLIWYTDLVFERTLPKMLGNAQNQFEKRQQAQSALRDGAGPIGWFRMISPLAAESH